MGGGKTVLIIFLNCVHIFLALTFFQIFILFPLFRSRGGMLFELEGEEVNEDLDGMDFDNLEALATAGRV